MYIVRPSSRFCPVAVVVISPSVRPSRRRRRPSSVRPSRHVRPVVTVFVLCPSVRPSRRRRASSVLPSRRASRRRPSSVRPSRRPFFVNYFLHGVA